MHAPIHIHTRAGRQTDRQTYRQTHGERERERELRQHKTTRKHSYNRQGKPWPIFRFEFWVFVKSMASCRCPATRWQSFPTSSLVKPLNFPIVCKSKSQKKFNVFPMGCFCLAPSVKYPNACSGNLLAVVSNIFPCETPQYPYSLQVKIPEHSSTSSQ